MVFPSCLSHTFQFWLCYTSTNENLIIIAQKFSGENVKICERWQLFEAVCVIQVKHLVCSMGKSEWKQKREREERERRERGERERERGRERERERDTEREGGAGGGDEEERRDKHGNRAQDTQTEREKGQRTGKKGPRNKERVRSRQRDQEGGEGRVCRETPKQTSKGLENREGEKEKKGPWSRTEKERKAKRESRLNRDV